MYEMDFAAVQALVTDDSLGDWGGGAPTLDMMLSFLGQAPQPQPVDLAAKYGLPPGTEVMVVTEITVDLDGNEQRSPNVLFRLEGQARFTRYDVYMENQVPPHPLEQWDLGARVDKGEYDLISIPTMVIVRGEEVLKPVVWVQYDDSRDMYRLDEWQKKQDYLVTAAAKEATSTKTAG